MLRLTKTQRKAFYWLRHIHSSSRFDRSPISLLRAMLTYIRLAGLITLTETNRDPRERMLSRLPGFGSIKSGKSVGARDCAIVYRKKRFTPERIESWLLSDPAPRLQGVTISGPACYFRDRLSNLLILVITIHFPAHLTDVGQMRTWIVAVRAAGEKIRAAQAKHPGLKILFAADWNLDMDNPDNVERVLRLLDVPDLESSWAQHKAAMVEGKGTHGSRYIDDTFSNLHCEGIELLDDDNSSDHRPYGEILRVARRRVAA